MKKPRILEDGDVEYSFQHEYGLESEFTDYKRATGSGVYTEDDKKEWNYCINPHARGFHCRPGHHMTIEERRDPYFAAYGVHGRYALPLPQFLKFHKWMLTPSEVWCVDTRTGEILICFPRSDLSID